MIGCESYQEQLLAYLYDVLEPAERQALQAHLDQCGGCQAALTRARSHQRLLASAAKAEFPAVCFQPPAMETSREQPSVPFERPARKAMRAWVIAASILLLFGLGAPGAWWTARYVQEQQAIERAEAEQTLAKSKAQSLAAEHQVALARAEQGVRDLERQIQEFDQKQQEKWANFQQQIRQRQLDVVVTGPETVQAGALNNYHVRTQNLNGQPVVARLDARLRNEKKEVVYEENNVTCNGVHRITLPRDLALKPGTKVALEIVAQREGSDDKSQVHEELALAAPVYLTHLTTDKPMYQPGETVHFRSLTLDRFSLRPADEDFHLVYTITSPIGEKLFQLDGAPRLADSKGQSPLLGPDKKPIRGIGAGEFAIPPTASGGEFTLTVSEQTNRFPEQKRKFIVNKYEKPRLNKELDFTRKSYGPGDDVVAACKVARAEGGLVANQPVTATIYIDGKPYGPDGKEGARSLSLRTNDKGAVNVHFKLPAAIDRGQGSLSVVFTDNNLPETLVRPIPIVVKKLQVEFFPEGGDLVNGVPNRVYFQARTMLDKPAEVKGRIVDQDGKVVVEDVHTLNDDKEPGANQGMGRFTFAPQPGRKYELKVDAPSGIEGKYALAKPKPDGVVLSIPSGVTNPKEPIRIALQSPQKGRTLLVGAYCRGRLMDHQTVIAPQGEAIQVKLKPAQEVGGVYRVTVFEELEGNGNRRNLKPVAERLVYRKPAEQLLLTVKPSLKQYTPGEKATCTITAVDEKEKPAPAIVMFAVVDKSVVTMADEKTYRTMPTHYFLTTEVRRAEDLEYADFLLGTHPKATAALDLLLGTQGWRRFAEQDPHGFPAKFKDDADKRDAQRLLVTNGQFTQKAVDLAQKEAEKLQTDYTDRLAKLQEQHAQASLAWRAAQNTPDFLETRADLEKQAEEARQARLLAINRLDAHRALVDQARALVLPGLAIVLLLVAGVRLIIAIRRRVQTGARFQLAAVWLILIAGLVALTPWDRFNPRNLASNTASDKQPQIARADSEAGDLTATVRGMKKTMAGGPGGPVPAPTATALKMAPRRAAGLVDNATGLRQEDNFRQLDGAGKGAEAEKLRIQQMDEQVRFLHAAPLARTANEHLARDKAKANLAEAQKQLFLFADKKKGELDRKQAEAKEPLGELLGRELGKEMEVARKLRIVEEAVPEGRLAPKDLRVPALQQAMPAAGAAMAKRAMPLAGGGMMHMEGMIRGGRGFDRLGAYQMGAERMGLIAQKLEQPPPPPLVIREYAHQRLTASPTGDRVDRAETLYWHPVLVLPDGKAEVSFDLCDSVTTFQMTAFGHTLDGRLGAVTGTLESRLPFTLEPKLPIEVTASDKIDVAVSIANNTNEPRPVTLDLTPNGFSLEGKNKDQFTLDAEKRTRRVFRLRPTLVEGQASLRIEGISDPFRDPVARTLSVVPDGFPVVGSHSDLLEKVAQNDLVLPETWVKGTLKCQVQVYPSTLADLQKGLEALLREPGGCFEQTSSSNYPNVLILSYLKESEQAKPEIERQALEKLAHGYQILTSFECLDPGQNNRKGYEWFGGTAPPHEALTAYGLLEFRDMARVYNVDPKMVERTRQYLMSRKDGKGGFERNPRAIDTFGRAPDAVTNAYIVWALTESGKEDDVSRELAALTEQAKTSKDPYFLALLANSLINRERADEGVALLKTVAAAQKEDGHLEAAQTSITGSGGRDLQIETTALAVLGWLKANRPVEFNLPLQKAVKWIGQQRGGYGGFGSTQSTILALKALIAFTNANKKTPEGGDLRLHVGDQAVAHSSFAAGVQEALVLNLPEPEKHLKPGKNAVRVEITGKNVFPYTLSWSYQTLKPASAGQCPVRLSTRLDRTAVNEGDTVHLTATLENTQDKGQGMAVAIVGLPAGLTLPEDMKQLKDHARLRNDGKEKGLIGAWETRGREVILYWRDLAPRQKIEVPLDLICRVPGEYRGPASRAYLYYNADLKHWVDPLQVTIKAKAE